MKSPSAEPQNTRTTRTRVVVDGAGGAEGGAARFLRELKTYLAAARPEHVELIGAGKKLTPQWLVQREVLAASATRRISLNNAGFVNPKGENVTLLRNILQFATQSDLDALAFTPPGRLRLQVPVIRKLARASDTIVVPSTRMADQVEGVVPSLARKITTRFHPVSQPTWAGTEPKNPHQVLLPIVPWPYKNLDQHIEEFLAASEGLSSEPVVLVVPSTPEEVLPGLAPHPRVKFIGQQPSEKFERWWRESGAAFFPTEFEAFGYPLAEARVYGRNIIAQNTSQNRELAAAALHPYDRGRRDDLREAISRAITGAVEPDAEPFNPAAYFQWLLDSDIRPR